MRCLFVGVVAVSLLAPAAGAAENLQAGFAEADITPPLDTGKPVYLAGYGMNRKATGVHDPIMARCIVLENDPQHVS